METINKYGEDVTEEIESVGGFSKQEIEEFVYNNRARYYAVFKKNENKRFFLHFNWAALLLSVYWMFYRKMYVEGIVFMLVSTLLSACLLTVSGYAVAAAKVPIQEQYTAAISASARTNARANCPSTSASAVSNKVCGIIRMRISVAGSSNQLSLANSSLCSPTNIAEKPDVFIIAAKTAAISVKMPRPQTAPTTTGR